MRFFEIEKSWQQALQDEWKKPYMASLAAFVELERAQGATVYPAQDLVFNAFRMTPFDQTKVVIMGQDPYHGPGQAHGLSFSVPMGVPPPPSLQNIYKELATDLNMETPKHGCLLAWAKQGVLLLNASLTVRGGEPMSHHGKGWEQFTDAVINRLADRPEPVIFVLWGKSAQEKCRFLKTSNSSHTILTAAHPSPLSAHNGFFGCRHFSRINQLLEQQGVSKINWQIN